VKWLSERRLPTQWGYPGHEPITWGEYLRNVKYGLMLLIAELTCRHTETSWYILPDQRRYRACHQCGRSWKPK